MSANKKTLIDGDFQVGSGHFYVDVENNRVGLNQMNPTSSLDVNGNAYIATDMTIGSNVLVGSNVIAQKFTGSASGLTSIPADQISGVISVANGGTGTSTSTGTGDLVKSDTPTFTGTVTAGTFSGSGASLTNIPLDQVTGVLAVLNGGTGVTTTTGTGSVVYSESPTLTGTVVADGANFSSNISVSNVYAGYNTDTTSYLGRAAVGFSGITDEATFAHIDVNSTNNYALKQTATGGTHVNAATTKSVIFSINDSEQARINTTGVGIGTDNPSYKLDVHGTANVGALTCTTVSGDGSGLLNVPGFSWPTHANGVDIYHITGNVGIGTTTPGTTLEVAGTAGVAILKSAASAAISTYNFILNGPRPGTTSGGAIHFINGSTRTGDGDGSTYTIRNDSGKLRLGNASYDTLLEGNVGIGVMIPNSKLQVNGTVTASSFSGIQVGDVPTLNQNTTGSAATLTTARTIGGVSFNGGANITLPGVNAVGNQNTTGSAATLTTSRNINGVAFNGGSDINVISTSTFGVSATGGANAAVSATNKSNGLGVDIAFTLPQGPPGANSTVAGPAGPPGANSTVAGPPGPAGSVAAGGTINRILPYSSTYAKGYNSAAIEVREYNLQGSAGGTEWERAPRIGFHWSGRVASQIICDSAGTINIANNPGTGYEKLRAGPVEALGEIYTTSMMRLNYNNPTINFQDTDHRACFLHNNSNLLYVLNGTNNATGWSQVNGQWAFVFNLSNNDATCGGNFSAVGNVTAYSDIRHKKNIVKISDSLNKLHKLNGYTYDRKDTGKRYSGLIAQEVQKVLPEVVNKDEKGYLSVAYGNMAGLFVEAIKELTTQLKIERERVDVLSKKLGI